MASPNNDPNTIDLTLDGDTPPSASRRQTDSPDFYLHDSPYLSSLRSSAEVEQRRAPLFGRVNGAGNMADPFEVIDLTDDDDDPAPRPAPRPRVIPIRSPSPEIQFVRERPAQAALRRPNPPVQAAFSREPWQTAQQPAGAIGRVVNHMLGNFHIPWVFQTAPMATPTQGAAEVGLEIMEADGIGDINFNYQQTAFQVGNRESETPQAATQEPYKAPPAPREGYVRTYEEENILICPYCENELASGGKDDDDPRRQVWVIKACGHVSLLLGQLDKLLTILGLLRRLHQEQSPS